MLKIDEDGNRRWFLNRQFHREGGSAIEYADGGRSWYLHGERHREDGPAIEWAGNKEWFLNDRMLTPEQHERAVSRKERHV